MTQVRELQAVALSAQLLLITPDECGGDSKGWGMLWVTSLQNPGQDPRPSFYCYLFLSVVEFPSDTVLGDRWGSLVPASWASVHQYKQTDWSLDWQ